MKSIDLTLTENELKFLIDLMWRSPLGVIKDSAERHGVDDGDVEGHLARCLGYMHMDGE
jgi:hypothetical protein